MFRIICLLALLQNSICHAEPDSLFCRSESPVKGKQIFVTSLAGIVAAGSLSGLATIWYKEDNTSFRFFNDFDEWKQMDKAGHLASTYNASLILADLYRWSGMEDRKSRVISSAESLFYMSAVEVMDGYSAGYGFSTGDMAFNALGSAAAYFNTGKVQRYYPLIKFSYRRTSFPSLNPDLLGRNILESVIKDYNGQTYWISFPGLISKAQWVCVSVGYGATNMVNARDIQSISKGFTPRRQYYLSLDADLARVKFRSCFLSGFFSLFRFVKIPFPAIEFSGKKFSVVAY